MKLAFATTFDGRDIRKWSGTPFFMANHLRDEKTDIQYIGNLDRPFSLCFKVKKLWKKLISQQRESPRFNIHTAKHYSAQVKKFLQNPVDAIIAPQINPIAYLDCKQPIILWTDSLYADLVGFYPGFSDHTESTIQQGNIITRECLKRCEFVILSSEWAAKTAIETYQTPAEKVKVIPFGANIDCSHKLIDIQQFIKSRSKKIIKLLFLGKCWERKSGEIVFQVAKALHQQGHAVELNFVGCLPPPNVEVPAYIKCHGFISKRTDDGAKKIAQLLRESHFLFVPSQAEAYGIVFCEANAFGLPCLTSTVGGIPTIVKDNINGMKFSLDAPIEAYCDYIVNVIQNDEQYKALALSAFNEYETRLNWKTATAKVKAMIHQTQ